MSVKASCPYCEEVYTLADSLAGKRIKCKACDETFVVPFGDDEEDAPRARKKSADDTHREVRPSARSAPRPRDEEEEPRPRKRSREEAEEEEDEEERSAPRKRKGARSARRGVPVWVWVLVAVGGVMLLGCGGCGLGFYFFSTNERLIIGKWISKDPMTRDTVEFTSDGKVRIEEPGIGIPLGGTYRFVDRETVEMTIALPLGSVTRTVKVKVGWSEMTLTDERGRVDTYKRF